MGGHSHWAGIKHKKALVDAKKGKVFTKILRETLDNSRRMWYNDSVVNHATPV